MEPRKICRLVVNDQDVHFYQVHLKPDVEVWLVWLEKRDRMKLKKALFSACSKAAWSIVKRTKREF